MKQLLHNRVNREILLQNLERSTEARTTLSFYKYVFIANPNLFRDHLFLTLDALGVMGRIYIAHEGINGQISVPDSNHESLKNCFETIDYLMNMRLNYAIEDNGKSFFKLKIKVRDKIVADGITDPNFDVENSGIHLDAAAFNKLTEDPNTIIVDMRNHYESEVGHFENAIRPQVTTFRESLPIIAEQLQEHKNKQVVMYCTGGIRCEKASAYMKYQGFEHVYQLNGGIIEYARQVNQQNLENKFRGKNFVFDERLGERISKDIISHCHQCNALCDTHINCANDQCHILFIQCDSCKEKYNACCSQLCSDFHQLPLEEQKQRANIIEFNGSKFSKGRYKAIGLDVRLGD